MWAQWHPKLKLNLENVIIIILFQDMLYSEKFKLGKMIIYKWSFLHSI